MLISGLDITMDVVSLFAACFDGDTLVATENGFKRIDEIQVGDMVWSYNVETGEKTLKEVKEVFVKENNELLHLETTEGDIDATTNHPFYVTDKGWIAAGDLVIGDKLHTLDGDTGTVTGLKLKKLDEPMSVYNLDVEDFHSYFVISGVLVHNAKCGQDDQEHHSYPVYVGGDKKQDTTPIPGDFHLKVFHIVMDRFFPRRGKGKAPYAKEFGNPDFQRKVYKTMTYLYGLFEDTEPMLKDFLKNFYKQHPDFKAQLIWYFSRPVV